MSTIACMIVVKEGTRDIVPLRWETDLDSSLTFGDLYEKISTTDHQNSPVVVDIGHKLPNKDASQWVAVALTHCINLLNLQGANIVRYKLLNADERKPSSSGEKTVNDILMGASRKRKLPDPIEKEKLTMDENLYNDILEALRNVGIDFKPSVTTETARQFVKYMKELIWYLDPHWKTLIDQGFTVPAFINIVYQCRNGRNLGDRFPYNDFLRKQKPKPSMEHDKLLSLANRGYEFLQTVWLTENCWKNVKTDLERTVYFIKKYTEMLKRKNETMKKLHNSSESARSSWKDFQVFVLEKSDSILPQLRHIDALIVNAEEYEPISLNEVECIRTLDKRARYTLLNHLTKKSGLSRPISYYRYTPSGGLVTYHFIWVLPVDKSLREDDKCHKTIHNISLKMPVYHTRFMRQNFKESFRNLVTTKAVVMDEMYRFLTHDSSVPQNKASKDVLERLHVAMICDDEEIVFDLREMNTGRPEKYDEFWDGLHTVLNKDFPAAVEERRHDTQSYLPVAISVRDLIAKVQEEKPGIDVPSESWILLQFTPKNRSHHSALNYTSKYDITYRLQSRSHHTKHQDTYYCMALYKYVREFAARYHDVCNFFSEDDKHAVNVGDPGTPLATLLRGKKVMVLKGNEPVASDHDWHRFKLCPSVLQHVEIPDVVEKSFYGGKVHVTLKDAIFQSSNPLRHQVEKEGLISEWKPIEVSYSDGGPDHNARNYSVKIAHIAHFLKVDLDMSVSAITYPGGSYINVAERAMPLLNIAMAGVSLSRKLMQPEYEDRVKSANSMEAIRTAVGDDEELKNEIKKSLQPCIELLEERYARVQLHGKSMVVGKPATEEEILSLFDEVSSRIDSTLTVSVTQKAEIEKHEAMWEFLNSHSRSRQYMFQLRKCYNSPLNEILRLEAVQEIQKNLDDRFTCRRIENLALYSAITIADLQTLIKFSMKDKIEEEEVCQLLIDPSVPCNICKPPRLPLQRFLELCWVPDPTQKSDDTAKYQHFCDLYGVDTDEKDRPSFVENLDQPNKHLLIKEKVVLKVACSSCFMPRLLYADKKFWKTEKDCITRHIETIHYFCGSPLFPEEHRHHSSVVVRRMLKCNDPLELLYFSCKQFLDLCYYCASSDNLCPIPDEIKKSYKTIYPLCENCERGKRKWFTRMPLPGCGKKKSK